MDLHVERQCVAQMKEGNARQFLLLFDANFEDVYKYVSRRVSDNSEAERIVRLTFLDALGQIQGTPSDISYLIWLYSLAKPRVWEHIAKISFPERQGLISGAERSEASEKEADFVEQANKVFGKLSMEEREILKLKFFEQVSDADVSYILISDEGKIGTKIYRVLKRAHFLLFGESDEKQGVYFGELSSFFEKLRDMSKIEVSGAFKLSLKADLSAKIERKDFAIDAELVKEEKSEVDRHPITSPFEVKNYPGSNDPAKIFVEAVREMREEEALEKQREEEVLERSEAMYGFMEKWKRIFILIPVILFVIVAWSVLKNISPFKNEIVRGYPTSCGIEVSFKGKFSDAEMRSVSQNVSSKLCEHFEVKTLMIARGTDGALQVSVDVPDWFLEYKFVKKIKDWRIKKYVRTLSSNEKSGQV